MKQSSIKSTLLCPVLIALLIPWLPSCGNLPRKTTTASALQSTTKTLQRPTTKQIRLNGATRAELERLPAIGRVLAERIVAHRNRYGPFRRVEHLMIVPGISERKFRELRPMIVAD